MLNRKAGDAIQMPTNEVSSVLKTQMAQTCSVIIPVEFVTWETGVVS